MLIDRSSDHTSVLVCMLLPFWTAHTAVGQVYRTFLFAQELTRCRKHAE